MSAPYRAEKKEIEEHQKLWNGEKHDLVEPSNIVALTVDHGVTKQTTSEQDSYKRMDKALHTLRRDMVSSHRTT